MKISFSKNAKKDIQFWAQNNFAIIEKIHELIMSISLNPNEGIGKPEALIQNLSGYWSRRITDEHRLVYKVKANTLYILSCRFHYSK